MPPWHLRQGNGGRGRVEAGVALNTAQNKSEGKILVVSQEVLSADFFMAHVLKYSKYGKSLLRKRVSHMAEMLQFDWLEPRGMNDSTGTLGSVSWKALFIAKSRASD